MDNIPAPPRKNNLGSLLGVKSGARQYASRKTAEERTYQGVVFDSMDEMRAFMAAEPLVPACWLHTGETFSLLSKKEIWTRGNRKLLRPMTWSCDLMVGPARAHNEEVIDDRHLVIDIKGSIKMVTPEFKIKLKLFEWRYSKAACVVEINSKKKLALFQDQLRQHVAYLNTL